MPAEYQEDFRRWDSGPMTMSFPKSCFVHTISVLLGISFFVFLVTGYSALYWAWLRADPEKALPYLPWARNFGMLAIACATTALGILSSVKTFPIPARTRLLLSLLATATIGCFAEFRNEGKFYFKGLVHFFGPGTWIHDALNRVAFPLGDFLYRFEYSHWNDFLMGPAIVSILFSVAYLKIYEAFRNQTTAVGFSSSTLHVSTNLEDTLRFARILMNVGLFWFFIEAWAEKAGYLSNPHSRDEFDLPFEFVGTMIGFWMTRALTRPFNGLPERFRSTFLIDILASGVVGLLYTFIIGPLTEGVASIVAHGLYPVVPSSLDAHEYTPLQQHIRPIELLLLATATWLILNKVSKHEEFTQLSGVDEVRH